VGFFSATCQLGSLGAGSSVMSAISQLWAEGKTKGKEKQGSWFLIEQPKSNLAAALFLSPHVQVDHS